MEDIPPLSDLTVRHAITLDPQLFPLGPKGGHANFLLVCKTHIRKFFGSFRNRKSATFLSSTHRSRSSVNTNFTVVTNLYIPGIKILMLAEEHASAFFCASTFFASIQVRVETKIFVFLIENGIFVSSLLMSEIHASAPIEH
jgi:hypothetical protein